MKKGRLISLTRIFAVAFLLLSTAFANAQEEATFVGSIDSLWSKPGNWADGLKPNENVNYVIINADVLVDENVTIQNLLNAAPCTLTVQSGKKLTVSASIVWNNGDFILEDGAQLVYQQDLNVIVKKKIVAYNEDAHALEFVASPVMESFVPTIENGFLTDPDTGFDLAYYDEENRQWVKFQDTPFSLENGRGYAYINAFDTVLRFEGTVRGSAAPVEVELDYHSSSGAIAGCNMVGNPLPCNALTDRSYYALDEKGKSLLAVPASSATAIPPCKGIFVKAESAGEVVSFSKTEDVQIAENRGYVELSVSKTTAQDESIDNAIISFNSGDDLGQITMFQGQPSLYFSKESKDLAIISIDSVDALPLKFKAGENGSYTLRFEPKGLDLSFLHLVDNLAGSNIDLLGTPNYTFNANTNDYASRFKLIFDPHNGVEEYQNQAFAYYSNGEIRLVADAGTVSLQVIDMMGRVVLCRDGECTVTTADLPKGVYVLRLMDGNSVRVQKIVID